MRVRYSSDPAQPLSTVFRVVYCPMSLLQGQPPLLIRKLFACTSIRTGNGNWAQGHRSSLESRMNGRPSLSPDDSVWQQSIDSFASRLVSALASSKSTASPSSSTHSANGVVTLSRSGVGEELQKVAMLNNSQTPHDTVSSDGGISVPTTNKGRQLILNLRATCSSTNPNPETAPGNGVWPKSLTYGQLQDVMGPIFNKRSVCAVVLQALFTRKRCICLQVDSPTTTTTLRRLSFTFGQAPQQSVIRSLFEHRFSAWAMRMMPGLVMTEQLKVLPFEGRARREAPNRSPRPEEDPRATACRASLQDLARSCLTPSDFDKLPTHLRNMIDLPHFKRRFRLSNLHGEVPGRSTDTTSDLHPAHRVMEQGGSLKRARTIGPYAGLVGFAARERAKRERRNGR
jgi:hypothetical protein